MLFGTRSDCVVFSVGMGTIAVFCLTAALASGKYYEGAVCTSKEQEIYDAWESSLGGMEVPAELKYLAKLSFCSSGKSYLICEHEYAPGQCPPIALISLAAIFIYIGWIAGIIVLILLHTANKGDNKTFTLYIPLVIGIIQGFGGILIAFFYWRITEAHGCDTGSFQTKHEFKQCHPIYRDELIDVAVTCALDQAFCMFMSLFKSDDGDSDEDDDNQEDEDAYAVATDSELENQEEGDIESPSHHQDQFYFEANQSSVQSASVSPSGGLEGRAPPQESQRKQKSRKN